MQPAHIINIDIQDNHEEATIGAFLIGDLVTMVSCGWSQNFKNCGFLIIDYQNFKNCGFLKIDSTINIISASPQASMKYSNLKKTCTSNKD